MLKQGFRLEETSLAVVVVLPWYSTASGDAVAAEKTLAADALRRL